MFDLLLTSHVSSYHALGTKHRLVPRCVGAVLFTSDHALSLLRRLNAHLFLFINKSLHSSKRPPKVWQGVCFLFKRVSQTVECTAIS
eukprot:m.329566 g.329566  ORF g.329566 m.329566 type:complete len:87 (-) comp16038_c0_seq2:3962-4222(-)